MAHIRQLISSLTQNGVEFVVIGGLAAAAQGSPYQTQDVDICYSRNRVNLERLVAALKTFAPRLRGAPEGLPFVFDLDTLDRSVNLTLTTIAGHIDLFGEVPGLGAYEQVQANSQELDVDGMHCRVLNLEGLILTKRASGRPKDLALVPHLEALLAMRKKRAQR